MAFTTPYTFTALETLTAAKMNAIQANITAIWVGTTAGDMDYYTSSSAKSRVAIGGAGALMKSTGSAPSWLAKGTAFQELRMNSGATSPEWANPKNLHATAWTIYNTDTNTASPSYIDVTSATVNITTSVTCDIIAFFQGEFANLSAGVETHVRGVIGATTDTATQTPHTSQGYFVPFMYMFRVAGIAAATTTCKLQYVATGSTAYIRGGYIFVAAIHV